MPFLRYSGLTAKQQIIFLLRENRRTPTIFSCSFTQSACFLSINRSTVRWCSSILDDVSSPRKFQLTFLPVPSTIRCLPTHQIIVPFSSSHLQIAPLNPPRKAPASHLRFDRCPVSPPPYSHKTCVPIPAVSAQSPVLARYKTLRTAPPACTCTP